MRLGYSGFAVDAKEVLTRSSACWMTINETQHLDVFGSWQPRLWAFSQEFPEMPQVEHSRAVKFLRARLLGDD